MSSLELNKFAAAILLAGVIAMMSGFIAKEITHPHMPEEPVYVVAGTGGEAGPAEAEAPAGPEPVLALLAGADPAEGQKVAKKCAACHTFDQGGANKVGPNLYGVVGRQIASHEGFSYSDALLAHAEETWTYQHLNAFMDSPKAFAPGTKMTFAGLHKVDDRAAVIAYLRSQADSPAPLPSDDEIAAETAEAAPAETPAAEEAPAEQAAAEEAPAEEAPAEEATAEEAPAEQPAAEEATAETEASGEPDETQQAAAGGAATAGLAGMIAAVEPDAAKKVSRKCAACHTFEEGGKNKIGPNLYGVIGRPIASTEGFKYSSALSEHTGDSWSYTNLEAFLTAPKEFAPGTKMTFAGLRKPEDRAAILAFLRTFHDDPPPVPE